MVINIPSQVNRAIEILGDGGYSAYIVGGAVRNIIMGVPVNDWDITTSALPEQTLELFKDYRTIETGIKHGTVTVIIDGIPLEITTYRIEKGYSDNRHPDNVEFTDKVEDDLSRRDFTVNAIAYSPKTGLVDPFGGCFDIKNKTIRCVGNPNTRFDEDALRILRALRFSSVLGFETDQETADSIFNTALHYELPILRHVAYPLLAEIAPDTPNYLMAKHLRKMLHYFPEIDPAVLNEIPPLSLLREFIGGCTINES